MADTITKYSDQRLSDPKPHAMATPPAGIDAFALDLSGFWRLLKQNYKIIVGAVIIALLVAFVVTLLTKPVYRATSIMRFEANASSTVQINSSNTVVSSAGNFEREAATQAELFSSRAMAKMVIDNEKLTRNGNFLELSGLDELKGGDGAAALESAAINYLRARVSTHVQPDTELTEVNFDSSVPKFAARMANAYAAAAVQMDLQHKFDSTTYAREFLTNQLQLARQRLEQSEMAYNSYIAKYGLITVGGDDTGQRTVVSNNLASSAMTANEATNKRIEAEQILRVAQSSPVLGVPQIQSDQRVQEVRSALGLAQAKLSQDRQTYGDSHPIVMSDREAVSNLTKELNGATAAVMNTLRTQYETARKREEALLNRVNGLKSDAENEERLGVRSNILKREVETNRTLYDALLQRQKEISAASGVNKSNISIVDNAQAPSKPESPNLWLNLTVGLVAGLFFGLLTVLIKSQLHNNLFSPTDFAEATGLPVLGVTPAMDPKGDPKANLIKELESPLSSISEANFSIITHLALSRPEGLSGVIQVTSARESEGKSSLCYSLARTMARKGSRVLLIDADLRRSSVHTFFKSVDRGIGLAQLLSSNATFEEVVQDTGLPNLSVITGGAIPPSPTELLSHSNFDAALAKARSQFDVVMLDTPPLLGLADALLIAAKADGVIFTVESNRLRRAALQESLQRLRTASPVLLGIVVTKFAPDDGEGGYYYYAYDYNYKTQDA